jgi:hypothetical protein
LNNNKILNGIITTREIESIIQSLTTKKSSGPDGFIRKFYPACKGELSPVQRIEENISNSIYEANKSLTPKNFSKEIMKTFPLKIA